MEDHGYHNQQRLDVLAHVAVTPASTVLDVGCGTGAMGRTLSARGCRQIYGIEVDPEAAAEARRFYADVIVGDVDSLALDFGETQFDAIVCADILEHLRDPWRVLKRLRHLMKPEGALVASIPNFRNVATLCELVMGDFQYTDWGIQDRSHLRFFTRKSIVRLFSECGYHAQVVGRNQDANAAAVVDLWRNHQLPERLEEVLRMMVGVEYSLSNEDLNDLLTIQYIVKASPVSIPSV